VLLTLLVLAIREMSYAYRFSHEFGMDTLNLHTPKGSGDAS
jgi:hypothetical protein